ncbi:helix-turn-helix domain-containing protein [Sphaerisporangium corydalis]|uniref:MerR family transcriptional regulator n=1 Tax=Sphaerisporangium corydalis TaxID=1441875 RepID=A0ABV9EFN9_9ACTN|nr:MerR family transcriptional regulator [Sphaerisporangium corydalis]
MDGEGELLTIGQLAGRTGLSARTIRFWSDAGAVPPSGRSAGGYRLYDDEAVARLELVSTLRDLGLGLEVIQRILSRRTSLAEAVEVHAEALDAEIRLLRSRRAILRGLAKYTDIREMPQMHKLARKSAEERQQIIDEFVTWVFEGVGGQETEIVAGWMREMPSELPDDPAPEQVEAWIELGDLVADADFRGAVRRLVLGGREDSRLEFGLELRPLVLLNAGGAVEEGV